ncbi:MAG: M20/M25/M40 family metallo-hydrolase [Candidatus Coatesbacteria bacterium]|nr:MAG: M20/M25/M40 family metallo-hydrolase [Candidatus Coatesbacteria bacterium]
MLIDVDKKRLRDTFLDLVRVPSPSGKERPVADYVIERIGGRHKLIEDGTAEQVGGDAGNILVRVPGDGAPVLLAAHMDTVGPCDGVEPKIRSGYVVSAGDTILGADNKCAIAAFLEFLEVADSADKRRPVEVLFTVSEEVGLLGAKHLDYSLLESKTGYVFDTSEPPGHAVTSAPSSDILTAVIHGRAAHAGIEPEKGVSAVQIASAAIAEMRLGRIDHETTANIGEIEGGKAVNIVPAEATVKGEVRSHDDEKLAAQVEHITKRLEEAAERFGGSAEINWGPAYKRYAIPYDAPVVTRFANVCDRLGLETAFIPGGGGSDANIFNVHGIESIVLGCGMENPHTTDERISLTSLEKLAKLAVELAKANG